MRPFYVCGKCRNVFDRIYKFHAHNEGQDSKQWTDTNGYEHIEVLNVIENSGFKIIAKNGRYKNLELFMCEWNWETLLNFFNRKAA